VHDVGANNEAAVLGQVLDDGSIGLLKHCRSWPQQHRRGTNLDVLALVLGHLGEATSLVDRARGISSSRTMPLATAMRWSSSPKAGAWWTIPVPDESVTYVSETTR
jgi:hypothetical protein